MDQIRNIIIQVEKYKNNQDFQSGIEMLQKALTQYSDDYRLYEEMADIYIYQGEEHKAKSAVDFALTLNSKSATGNYLK